MQSLLHKKKDSVLLYFMLCFVCADLLSEVDLVVGYGIRSHGGTVDHKHVLHGGCFSICLES